jgi:nitrous oxide reductase accessory protein NosL
MKKYCAFGKVMLSLTLLLSISFFVMPGMAVAQEDVAQHPACPYCGMDRAKFAHSRVYMEYDDGTTVGTCALHCAALDMAFKIDKTPKAIMVGDYSSKRLIDAEKAFWVIGGSKMGVMTTRAKWAFEKKEDADQFVKEFRGELATFDDAVQAAFEDMHKDLKMIREKRKMKRMKQMKH